MYSATGMTRPRWLWPQPTCVEGMACALACTSFVNNLRDKLVGVPTMGVRRGCRKVRDAVGVIIVVDGKSRNTRAEWHGVAAVVISHLVSDQCVKVRQLVNSIDTNVRC